MHNYQRITQSISVPPHLKEQVLSAAKQPQRKKTLLRPALCTLCALMVLLGSISLETPSAQSPSVHYDFALVASAAELTENHTLALRRDGNGYLFSIEPPQQGSLTVSSDRGTVSREGENTYTLSPAGKASIESLHGAVIALTVTYADGTCDVKTYTFSAETMRSFSGESGEAALVPALSGDPDGSIPVLYAATDKSRFLLWPAAGSSTVSLSFPYGWRETPGGSVFHPGIDIPGKRGTPVTAAAAGTVEDAGFNADDGHFLILSHDGNLTTKYSHCQEILVSAGETVEEGAVVALLGSSGMSTGPHLHFEVRENGEARNPISYFSANIRSQLQMG